ncbi:MAG: hypothetical protein BRC30_01435, partial [Nanohaloarchaea archaeon SW_7_46_7]
SKEEENEKGLEDEEVQESDGEDSGDSSDDDFQLVESEDYEEDEEKEEDEGGSDEGSGSSIIESGSMSEETEQEDEEASEEEGSVEGLEEEDIPEEDHEEVEYGESSLDEVNQSYKVDADQVPAKIMIGDKDDEYVPIYFINRPQISLGTEAFVDNIRKRVIENVELTREEFTDSDEIGTVKRKFSEEVEKQLDDLLPDSDERAKEILIGNLIHDMVGLGDVEILLNDPRLEELVINSADEPTWVYHQ